ncbi:beta-ketoacyl synthase N-terminal-like domain-containing protein [Geotalea uraniireducens]|uniref:Mycocerosate synthase n=1 Tax=Geotalea uraniireducens (strain Rf4) TaxID=351605 RepID=A5G645_GEOUR|nr:beta-ketoacyl synthase N-terminal-like domain-containing protein [Geotalea uraniireducens]ABQ27263.1 Mycocerosate synthase [Geotalea uraniireducens Rf4]
MEQGEMEFTGMDIAIIGMSCRFPGAGNYEAFWDNLKQGRSGITEIPLERWDWRSFWGDPSEINKSNSKWGGFLQNVDSFDAEFFRISAREAETMDPQQRIMLELSWSCFEDAGVCPSQLSEKKIGVYLGVFNFDYKELQEKATRTIDTYHSTGTAAAVIANRISHYYHLKGPSLAIDTACSSSLNAIHSAAQSLSLGECSMALAGGISLLLTPTRHISFAKTGMLSPTGSCKSFDEAADGYVRSEGAGLVLLKPLKEALEDGDSICGVLKGSAVNHNGKTHTLTYPDPEAQAEVIVEAHRRAGTAPGNISYIEAHGTGTPKGDPLEFKGLVRAFSSLDSKPGEKVARTYCGIGSLKSNIGHSESAAGIAGVIKVLLSLKHKQLPGLQSFKKLNHRIEIEDSPFYIVDRFQEWKQLKGTDNQPLPRRAGVSGFGFGGTNAHVVLEEAPLVARPLAKKRPCYLICLSARTKEALLQRERDLASWLDREGDTNNLAEISATLLLRREHFGVRAAFLAGDIQELQGKLQEAVETGLSEMSLGGPEGKVKGELQPSVGESGNAILKELAQSKRVKVQEYKSKMQTLSELYAKGYDLDWQVLYPDNAAMPRINLPTYPFARQRHWLQPGIDEINPIKQAVEEQDPGRLALFLKKQWELCQLPAGRQSDRAVAILVTQETRCLANRISDYFPKSWLLDLHDLKADLQQPDRHWRRYDACVDLAGCGREIVETTTWISWLQRLIDSGHRDGLMLLCVTKGLESHDNAEINLSGAPRAGLYRMLQSEYSHVRSRHLDADPSSDDGTLAEQIATELTADCEDPEICYRKGNRYRAGLVEHSVQGGRKIIFPENHVLWITGGTRGLGYLCARHFLENYGVKRLVLTGREPLPSREEWDSYKGRQGGISEKIQAIQELERRGAQVCAISLPLTDERCVQKNLRQIKDSMGPVGGVIHCAGFADFENPAFIRKSIEGIQDVLDPKIIGLDILYRNLRNEPLQFFMLFSSVSAIVPVLGSGQSDYATANGYMDYFAEAKHAACPIVSIQWPSWKESGMGEIRSRVYQQTGLLAHTDQEGLWLMDAILSGEQGPVILPAVVDPGRWNPPALMRRAVQKTVQEKILSAPAPAESSTPGEGVIKTIQAWLIELFAKELRADPAKLDLDTPFQDYGADSILLAQILRQINRLTEDNLDPSLLLEHSSLGALGVWLAGAYSERLTSALGMAPEQNTDRTNRDAAPAPPLVPLTHAPTHESQPRSEHTRGTVSQDIAVIGLSCRFPGAETLDQYWSLLSQGRSAIRAVPRERWGYSNAFHAGLLDDITCFDPSFFLIPEEDAKAMDPQALAILEETLKAWCHAGYAPREIKGTSVGVYVGARSQHRPDLAVLEKARNPTLVGQNFMAANISHFFDLRGPSVVIDTACSSALLAMNMGIQALHSGDIDSALVGGVSLLNTDGYHRIFQQRNILSPEPHFHLFDRRSAGAVLGEGAGVLVLKTVERALQDGDAIHAVIKAVAVNNDGRTAGPATPNLQAQKEVMRTALERSGRGAEEISYLEANGSGTEVTDLLELKAIQSVYRAVGSTPLGLGSMKPNIGHPLCAEGIASFIKVVLMLQHRQFVPFLSGERPMEHYDLESSPFYFCRELREWTDQPQIAAINCFADGGTNAHVIVEVWRDTESRTKRQPLPAPVLSRIRIYQDGSSAPLAMQSREASFKHNCLAGNQTSVWKRGLVEV